MTIDEILTTDKNEIEGLEKQESRRLYREWLNDPNRKFHPNAFHDPDICPGCFASYEHCVCKIIAKKRDENE